MLLKISYFLSYLEILRCLALCCILNPTFNFRFVFLFSSYMILVEVVDEIQAFSKF